MYPAAFESVVAVTAVDQNNSKAFFSSQGPQVELAAPGVNILSTVRGGYGYLSGTSQATPYVTGTAALVISAGMTDENGDGMIAEEVRYRLDSTAFDLGQIGRDEIFGYGLIDAEAALYGRSEEIRLTVTSAGKRQKGPLRLSRGNYSFTIENHGLNVLTVTAIGEDRRFRRVFNFVRGEDQSISFDLEVIDEFYDFYFLPSGRPGYYAEVFIRKL